MARAKFNLDQMSPVAREIYRRMTADGWNPKSLAVAAGLNDTYVRDILVGNSKNPKTEQLQKLAAVLKCDASDLTPTPDRLASPEIRDFIKADDVLPLLPAEVGLVRLWRHLSRSAKDELLLTAARLGTIDGGQEGQ